MFQEFNTQGSIWYGKFHIWINEQFLYNDNCDKPWRKPKERINISKLEKWNNSLNILIGSSIGVFLGYSIYKYCHYRKYPGLYELQSAPWHTSIQIYGLASGVVIVIAIIFKFLVKKKLRKNL